MTRQVKTEVLAAAALCLTVSACSTLPRDTGEVLACYGYVNVTIPGQGVPTDDVATNVYYGGCDPADPGMQVVVAARPGSDGASVLSACNQGCQERLARYAATHPEVSLPLSCASLFAFPCDGVKASLPVGSDAFLWSGGPADTRYAVSGSVTISIDGEVVEVPGTGVLDYTYGPCEGANQTCDVSLTRFDVKADRPFDFAGNHVSEAQVQSAGVAKGRQSGPEFLVPEGALNAEVNVLVGSSRSAFKVTNTKGALKSIGDRPGTLGDIDVTFGEAPRTVRLRMKPIASGHRPVAAITPNPGVFECACKECSNVSVRSSTTDQDGDLQSLIWKIDGTIRPESRETLSLALPLGDHAVTLVATDTRGAASATTAPLRVVDTTPPVLKAPADVTLRSCDFPSAGQATATDACSEALVASDDPGDYRVGGTTITWYAEDGALNVSRATQKVTVVEADPLSCCPAGSNIIVGTNLPDHLIGTEGPDCILGLDGADIIEGLGGDDYLIGGQGQDTLIGGPGRDTLLAGEGDDVLDGGEGNDRLAGGSAQDELRGGPGDDELRGGDGDDQIYGGTGADLLYGGGGQDKLYGEEGADVLAGNLGDDSLYGGEGNDLLSGGGTQDLLQSGAGDDTLGGNDGDDTLEGGLGDDLLAGGTGHNRCYGGEGKNRFRGCEVAQ